MQGRIQQLFGCDVRSLAAFRIGIGILVFVDALVRYGAAASFYSGEGFLDAALAKYASPGAYSLNYLSDSVGFQQLIFLALACSAAFLCVGCFTRVATFCCWLLIASIHIRNPIYLIGGDTLLRMLVFWCLFIPLGRAWSVDQLRGSNRKKLAGNVKPVAGFVCSVGTACLLLQVCVMYVTAGLSKWNEPWLSGFAMDYIFRQDCYARPLSSWLVQFPTFTSLVTYATLVIELVVPFLMFIPFKTGQLRLAAVVFFWAFHLGIEMTMDVGKFTYVSMTAWLLFLPPIFWDQFRWAKLRRLSTEVMEMGTEPNVGWLKRSGRRLLTVVVPFVLFVYIIIWNVVGLYGGPGKIWLERDPDGFYQFGNITMLRQNFHMFCIPARVNTTYLFSGRTVSGERVDLVRRIPAAKVGPGASLPEKTEWKTLHWYLVSFGGDPKIYEALLEYHAESWNRTAEADQQVYEARLEVFAEDIGPGVVAGSYVHNRNIAEWEDPDWDEVPAERLKQDFDRMMDRMENGGLFPTESD